MQLATGLAVQLKVISSQSGRTAHAHTWRSNCELHLHIHSGVQTKPCREISIQRCCGSSSERRRARHLVKLDLHAWMWGAQWASALPCLLQAPTYLVDDGCTKCMHTRHVNVSLQRERRCHVAQGSGGQQHAHTSPGAHCDLRAPPLWEDAAVHARGHSLCSGLNGSDAGGVAHAGLKHAPLAGQYQLPGAAAFGRGCRRCRHLHETHRQPRWTDIPRQSACMMACDHHPGG